MLKSWTKIKFWEDKIKKMQTSLGDGEPAFFSY